MPGNGKFKWKNDMDRYTPISEDVLIELLDNTDYLLDNMACISHNTADFGTLYDADNGSDHMNYPNDSYDGDDGD